MALHNSLTSQSQRTPFRLNAETHAATWLRILLVVAVNVGLLAALVLPIRQHVQPMGPQTPWFAWTIALLWSPIMALQALVFHRWVDGRPLSEFPLAFDHKARKAAVLSSVLALALMLAYVGLTQVTGVTHWRWNAGFDPLSTLLTTLVVASAGLGEEFLFRGYVMRTLGHYGPKAAALLSSVVFALMHMVTGRTSPLEQVSLFLHGYLFAVLFRRSKSVWPGLVFHFVYNGLTSVIWSGGTDTALLSFDGSLGWTKWAFKGAMIIPCLLLVRWIYGKKED